MADNEVRGFWPTSCLEDVRQVEANQTFLSFAACPSSELNVQCLHGTAACLAVRRPGTENALSLP
jgi:hypothetical protein